MRALLPILLLAFNPVIFGQVYSGRALEENSVYRGHGTLKTNYDLCDLKINGDSSIYFICYDRYFYVYRDYRGKMKKVNDTLSEINVVSCFFAGGCESHRPGMLMLCDRDNFVDHHKCSLRYQDGFSVNYDLNKSPVKTAKKGEFYYRCITLDDKHFHYGDTLIKKDGMVDRAWTTPIYFDMGYKNPITEKALIFKTFDNGFEFYVDPENVTFSVIGKRNTLKLVNAELGSFVLTKNKK